MHTFLATVVRSSVVESIHRLMLGDVKRKLSQTKIILHVTTQSIALM